MAPSVGDTFFIPTAPHPDLQEPPVLHQMLLSTVVFTTFTVVLSVTPAGRRLLGRGKRAADVLRQDVRVPRWYGWALLVLFAVPIPGELDEILGCVLLAVTWPWYGQPIREAWAASAVA